MKVQRNWFRFVSALVVCSLLLLTLGAAAPSSPTVRAIVTGTSLEAAIVAVEAHGGQVASEIEIINAVVADVPESRLMFLSGAPGVRNVTLDRQVEAAAQGGRVNVEFTKAIGAAEVWEAGTLGEGVTVAFLDSGVDPTFIELRRSANGGHSRLLAYYDAISEELYEPPHLLRSPRDPNVTGRTSPGSRPIAVTSGRTKNSGAWPRLPTSWRSVC